MSFSQISCIWEIKFRGEGGVNVGWHDVFTFVKFKDRVVLSLIKEKSFGRLLYPYLVYLRLIKWNTVRRFLKHTKTKNT